MPQRTPTDPVDSKHIYEIGLKDLAEVLIKHFGLHEGIYEVGARFNVAIGNFGTSPNAAGPGAILTLGGIGVSKSTQAGTTSIDAAIVNPVPGAAPVPGKRPAAKKATPTKSVK
jgi:hypothetical protein